MAGAVNRNDLSDIINTLIAEAYGEGPEGMRLVAETILNRSIERGKTPGQVVRAKSQYTGYSHPGSGAKRAQKTDEARTAAEAAWQAAQGPDDPTGGANHYFNPNIVTPKWAASMTPTVTAGGHAFYRDGPPIRQSAPSPVIPQATDLQSMRMSYARDNAPIPLQRSVPRDGGALQAALNARVAQPSNPFDYVNTSASPSPTALQAALNARVAPKVAPTPAGIDELLLARTGVGGSRIAPVQTASDRARGNIQAGAGLPQKTGGASDVGSMYAGIYPQSAAPIPASSDERLLARTGVGGSRIPTQPIIPSSNIERSTPRTLAPTVTPSIGASQIERVPVQQPYQSGNPFVDAAEAARQVANNRLAPSQANPPALYGASSYAPVGAPVPMPTIPRANPVPQTAQVSPIPAVRPNQIQPMGGPVATSTLVPPSPASRLQRQGFLPGVELPGIAGVLQNISRMAANSSGTLSNNYDNLLQRTMTGPRSMAVPIAQGQNGYLYGRDSSGGYVNLGAVNPSLTPSQRYEQAAARSTTGRGDAFSRMKERSGGSSSPQSLVG